MRKKDAVNMVSIAAIVIDGLAKVPEAEEKCKVLSVKFVKLTAAALALRGSSKEHDDAIGSLVKLAHEADELIVLLKGKSEFTAHIP